ncbi:MAG: hypothetical protein Q9166_007165 [cf. Caloplaca sp. 2 TL-2023]
MDIWHGKIRLDDGQPQIEDLHFSHPHASFPLLKHDASLRFLAVVETASVPLYLAAGPSLDAWTGSERTEQWLHQCLFESSSYEDTAGSGPWRQRVGGQSDNGILLGADPPCDGQEGPGPEITEILLYAAASNPAQDGHALPTPPQSSSPGQKIPAHRISSNIRLYALPLSSSIFRNLDEVPTVQESGITSQSPAYYYLPSPSVPALHTAENHVPKRPRVESLFEDATQNRRLNKKRGGEGIAKAMAAMDQRMAIPGLPSPDLPDPTQSKAKKVVPTTRSPLTRASTTGSINPFHPIDPSAFLASKTRRPTLSNGQRSSLHRVESAISPSLDGGRSSEIPEDGQGSTEVEQQNKNALSRIILAGMRMYGFQTQRKKSIGGFETQSQLVTGEQDEYKAVYHQTFKTVGFVYRRYWGNRVLGQEMLRDTVDTFLGRFCQDPFAAQGLDNSLKDAFSSQEQRQI